MAEKGEEEDEEETRNSLYLHIAAKLGRVHDELDDSGMNGECLMLIQQALQVWPGTVNIGAARDGGGGRGRGRGRGDGEPSNPPGRWRRKGERKRKRGRRIIHPTAGRASC